MSCDFFVKDMKNRIENLSLYGNNKKTKLKIHLYIYLYI